LTIHTSHLLRHSGYTDSIAGLKAGSSPYTSLIPSHSALKEPNGSKGSSSTASPSGESKAKREKAKAAKKGTVGSKASNSFLNGRVN
jgi:hypothetical protein